MRIKALLVILLTAFVTTGCHTLEGAAKGAQHGVKKDWESVQEADEWMKENMW